MRLAQSPGDKRKCTLCDEPTVSHGVCKKHLKSIRAQRAYLAKKKRKQK